MTLKAVLFDFGGTLDSDGVSWPHRFFPIYRDLGAAAEWDPFLKAFYRSDDSLAQRHRLEGLDLTRTVELQAEAVLEALAPERVALAADVARRFVAESRATFARNRPALEELRRHCRLGVVSNFYGNLESVLAGEGLLELFEATADSGRLGFMKPDARLFRHVLDRLGAKPDEAAMVGDSLPRDIRGAEALGMEHVWLDPAGQGPCCARGHSIRRLTELSAVIPAPVGAR